MTAYEDFYAIISPILFSANLELGLIFLNIWALQIWNKGTPSCLILGCCTILKLCCMMLLVWYWVLDTIILCIYHPRTRSHRITVIQSAQISKEFIIATPRRNITSNLVGQLTHTMTLNVYQDVTNDAKTLLNSMSIHRPVATVIRTTTRIENLPPLGEIRSKMMLLLIHSWETTLLHLHCSRIISELTDCLLRWVRIHLILQTLWGCTPLVVSHPYLPNRSPGSPARKICHRLTATNCLSSKIFIKHLRVRRSTIV